MNFFCRFFADPNSFTRDKRVKNLLVWAVVSAGSVEQHEETIPPARRRISYEVTHGISARRQFLCHRAVVKGAAPRLRGAATLFFLTVLLLSVTHAAAQTPDIETLQANVEAARDARDETQAAFEVARDARDAALAAYRAAKGTERDALRTARNETQDAYVVARDARRSALAAFDAAKAELRRALALQTDTADPPPVVTTDTAELEALQQQLATAQAAREQAEEAVVQLQEKLGQAEKALAEASDYLAQTQAEQDQMLKQIEGIKAELEGAQKALAEAETRLAEAEADLTTTETRLTEAEADLTTTETRLTETEDDLAHYQAMLADVDAGCVPFEETDALTGEVRYVTNTDAARCVPLLSFYLGECLTEELKSKAASRKATIAANIGIDSVGITTLSLYTVHGWDTYLPIYAPGHPGDPNNDPFSLTLYRVPLDRATEASSVIPTGESSLSPLGESSLVDEPTQLFKLGPNEILLQPIS